MTDVNSRIKIVRLHLKLTQKIFAERLGVKWYQIKDIETGKTKASVDILTVMCESFAINSDWLLTGRGNLHRTETTTIKNENSNLTRIVIEHQDLIKRFKNPEKAKMANENLLKLENNDLQGFNEACEYIDFKAQKTDSTQKKQDQNESFTKKQINGK